MDFELTGTLIEKFNEVQVTENFKKREFVIETVDGTYTEQIKFQLVQDKTSLLEPYQIGEKLKIRFNIRGNKWKENYFVNLQAWKIEKEQPADIQENTEEDTPFPTGEDLTNSSDVDDLPF
jgi:hypothetical protein